MIRASLLFGLISSARAETCTRWHTFGTSGINSVTDLGNEGWATNCDYFNWNGATTSPDYLTFFVGGGGNGFIEKQLPAGGDFVRVRYGNVYGGTTHLEVGGVNVGSAVSDDDVTTDAEYDDGDTLKVVENAVSVSNIYSVDVCNYDNGACFHGEGEVMLESGSPKRLSELTLGDRIKTSNGHGSFSFNSVLTLPHSNNSEPAAFLTLTTETGKTVDMTSDHFIPKCDLEEVTAGDLVVGDCLLTVDGKETLIEISSTVKNGVFTATTQDNFIVVDNIVASPYSKNSHPEKPELDYEKYRVELEIKRSRNRAHLRGQLQ
jgi:hypothetical protein